VIYLAFDGTDTFFVRYREAVVDVNQNIIGRKPLGKSMPPAYISSGNYPFAPWEEQQRTHVLWLVFSAGKYLHDSSTNTMLLPWIPARWSLLSYGFRVEHKLSLTPPFAPQELQFIRDGAYDLASDHLEMERPELNSPSSDVWIEKWEKELQERREYWVNGFVAGKLESRNFTNQNGLAIPMAFSFKAFHPRWKGNQLRHLFEGVVTNLASMPPGESFQPPIISAIRAEDSRFRFRDAKRALNGINYPLTATNKWPPRTSAENEREFKAALASPEFSGRYHSAGPRKRVVLVGMFALISVVLLRLFFRSTKDSSKGYAK